MMCAFRLGDFCGLCLRTINNEIRQFNILDLGGHLKLVLVVCDFNLFNYTENIKCLLAITPFCHT